jgi:hypothetical protein
VHRLSFFEPLVECSSLGQVFQSVREQCSVSCCCCCCCCC